MTQPSAPLLDSDLANAPAGPATLDDATFSALKTDVLADDSGGLSDRLEGISWLDSKASKELLGLALNADADECLCPLLCAADEQGLAEFLESRLPADRSVLFRAAIDNLLVDVLPRMLSPATAGLFTAQDLCWALERTLSESENDIRADEIASCLAPHCSPSPEQWAKIAASSLFAQDLPALLLAAQAIDLFAWRMNSGQAETTDMPEGIDFFSFASRSGSPEQIEQLLALGFDSKQTDLMGLTPLMHAAGAYAPDNVQALLPVSDLEATDDTQRTALSIAAATDSHDTVRLLLAAGANPNHQNSQGETPLIRAMQGRNAENVKILASVSDHSVRDMFGLTAFDNAMRLAAWDALSALVSSLPPQEAIAAVFKVAGKFIPEAAERAAREHEATQLRAQIAEGRLAARAPETDSPSARPTRL